MLTVKQICEQARTAAGSLATADTKIKNTALALIAARLRENTAEILRANQNDIEAAIRNGIRQSYIDRLKLSTERINAIADSIAEIIQLDDPIGIIDYGATRPNGMRIIRKRVPLGVVGVIYEARPNVTVDVAVLCLKSGNAAILKGGKEALASNLCLGGIIRGALAEAGLNPDCVIVTEDVSREFTTEMMRMNGFIDVLIPRGGAGLIRAVVENSTVPVIETGAGNCHIYIDESADAQMAVSLTDNGKTSRPSVCNSLETLLIHRKVASELLPQIKSALDKHRVEWRGCVGTANILGSEVIPVTEDDYYAEFNDYIIACKVVDSTDEAIEHIRKYSTKHSECIVTENYSQAEKFLNEVDAAAVYVNASTRFTDGGEFGFGAEIGISTQKLHVRGPMGLKELTTNKYVIYGNGQIR